MCHTYLMEDCGPKPFKINGAFTDVPVTDAMGTNTTPYYHRC